MVAGKAGGDSFYRKDIVPPPTTVGKLKHLEGSGGKTTIRGSTFGTPVKIVKSTTSGL